MSQEQIEYRMSFLLVGEELNRIKVFQDVDGVPILQVDLHLMTKKAAEKLIDNIIKIIRGNFRLRIIHGFHKGIVLRDMFCYEYENSRVVARYSPEYNPGETIYEVA